MDNLLVFKDDGIPNDAELVQELATYLWLKNGDKFKEFYTVVTGMRVFNELLNRLTNTEEIDMHKAECLAEIVKYIKDNPKASEDQLEKEVLKHVLAFKTKVATL